MILGPLFLPYFESERVYLLMMLRFLIPAVALGLPILFHQLSKLNPNPETDSRIRWVQIGLVVVLLAGYPLFLSQYSGLQGAVVKEFDIADRVGSEYSGGTIVCDIPSMLYRLVSEWDVEPTMLLSNHYGPQYYGIDEPVAYLEWFDDKDVSIWMYYGDRGDPVWGVLMDNYSGVLVNLFGDPGYGCYLVDRRLVDSLL